MAKLDQLLKQKAHLESQIRLAELAEKNKVRIALVVYSALEKYPRIAGFSDQVLRDKLDAVFADIVSNTPAA